MPSVLLDIPCSSGHIDHICCGPGSGQRVTRIFSCDSCVWRLMRWFEVCVGCYLEGVDPRPLCWVSVLGATWRVSTLVLVECCAKELRRVGDADALSVSF
jgi:hypothetical protein